MDDIPIERAPYDWGNADWSAIPEYLRLGIRRYVDDGIPAGGALTCILENATVRDAIAHLDPTTFAAMPAIIRFLYSNVPGICWGSRERVSEWIAQGGWRSRPRETARISL